MCISLSIIDEEKPIIGPVAEDDQGIKWWNEETSLK